MRLFFMRSTFVALIILAIGTFTTIVILPLAHILLFASGCYFLFKEKNHAVPPRIWALFAVWFACILSVIFNWNILEFPLGSTLKTRYFLIGALSYFALKYATKEYLTPPKIKLILSLALITTALSSLSGMIGLFSGFNPLRMSEVVNEERNGGLNGMLMTYAYGLNFFLVIAIGLWLKRKELLPYLNQKLLISSTIINIVGLYFTYTRGAWLGLLTAIPFFFFKKSKKTFIVLIAGEVVVLVLAILLNAQVGKAFLSRGDSNSQRLAHFQASWAGFKERPILGYGYHNFEHHSKQIKERHGIPWPEHSGMAHNNFLEHLASTGILGFLAFFFFCLFWVVESYRRKDIIGQISLPLSISFLVSGMVQCTFGDGENLYLLLLAVAL